MCFLSFKFDFVFSVLFIYLFACLLPNGRERKGIDLDGWMGGSEGVEGEKATIRIHCMEECFFIIINWGAVPHMCPSATLIEPILLLRFPFGW